MRGTGVSIGSELYGPVPCAPCDIPAAAATPRCDLYAARFQVPPVPPVVGGLAVCLHRQFCVAT